MNTPLISALADLLSTNTNLVGVVQSLNASEAIISTPTGSMVVPTLGAVLQEGDEVKVTNGVIVGKLSPRGSLPHYKV